MKTVKVEVTMNVPDNFTDEFIEAALESAILHFNVAKPCHDKAYLKHPDYPDIDHYGLSYSLRVRCLH